MTRACPFSLHIEHVVALKRREDKVEDKSIQWCTFEVSSGCKTLLIVHAGQRVGLSAAKCNMLSKADKSHQAWLTSLECQNCFTKLVQ